jgi:hypothetical protein
MRCTKQAEVHTIHWQHEFRCSPGCKQRLVIKYTQIISEPYNHHSIAISLQIGVQMPLKRLLWRNRDLFGGNSGHIVVIPGGSRSTHGYTKIEGIQLGLELTVFGGEKEISWMRERRHTENAWHRCSSLENFQGRWRSRLVEKEGKVENGATCAQNGRIRGVS